MSHLRPGLLSLPQLWSAAGRPRPNRRCIN